MRLVAAILFAALCVIPVGVGAQSSPFSEPPVGIPDFVAWGAPRTIGRLIDLADYRESLAVAKEAYSTGLCSTTEPSCVAEVHAEVFLRLRCIAQNDSEFPCERRMAWKRQELLGTAVRYTVKRADVREEGLAVEERASEVRLFFKHNGTGMVWEEVSRPVSVSAQQFFVDLMKYH